MKLLNEIILSKQYYYLKKTEFKTAPYYIKLHQ